MRTSGAGTKRPRRNLEHQSQAILFQWAALSTLRVPELALLMAIPNGGHRNKATAGKMKAEGVKAGALDVLLPIARGGFHSLWLEMKSPTGQPTKDQKRWMEALRAEGHAVHLCRSWQEAKDAIERYLALPKGAHTLETP